MNSKVTFKHILETVKEMVVLNLVFLVIMTLYRGFFFVYNADFKELSGMYGFVAKAFFLGCRFDLAILAYISSLVTLTLILVWTFRNMKLFVFWQNLIRFYYTLMFCLVLFVFIFDFGFYMYFKTHINVIIFGILEDDTKALVSSIWENYKFVIQGLSVGIIGFMVWLYYFTGRFKLKQAEVEANAESGNAFKIFFVTILLSVNFMAARGSFGLFPLGVMDAEISPNAFINKLSVTGLHSLQEAIEFRMKENIGYDIANEIGYEKTIEDAFSEYLGKEKDTLNVENLAFDLVKQTPIKPKNFKKPNVIVIMMEGFGTDILRYNSDNFNVLGQLKKHFDSDNLFLNFLSGDIGTIGSIETVLFNMPKRPNSKPITQSKYAYGEHAFGGVLPFKNSGYSTTFFYGGNANWRNMLTIMPSIGFDEVLGEGSMDPKYPRNQWGVYDQYLFTEIFKKLEAAKDKPAFIFCMTTTNHPPYSLPNDYNAPALGLPAEIANRITGDENLAKQRFATYQYSNDKLGEFITQVKKTKLGENTIIVVTGDHNFWDVFNYSTAQTMDLYSVPFYLYIPPTYKPAVIDTKVFGSHTDILITLYNLALPNAKYVSLGKDLLAKEAGLKPAYNCDGFVVSKTAVSKFSMSSKSSIPYTWENEGSRSIISSIETEQHKKDMDYYKSILMITDYVLKHPFKLQ